MDNPLFTPFLVVLNPGENQGNNITHKGQEFLYVIEGTLTVQIDQEGYILRRFDSIFLDSSKPHYWLNKTEKAVKFLCVTAEGE
ncbi:cupin domain-containing protein [Salinibacillus xinjiangensis]|uniref:cupin domain-containing protein n=1 Tax=Salinibacillus xinjiangensis TaxID=1229268 RepID=UPI001E4F3185|nr:cupin domain-containing protein [Salinibacillus xinjiangensis]